MSDAIVAEARTWLGTPFHHQNRFKGGGVDCIGLIVCVFDALGLPYEDERHYSRVPTRNINGSTIEQRLAKYCHQVTDYQPGDIGYTEIANGIPHVYFVADKGLACRFSMIHAYSTVGCVVEHDLTDKWIGRTRSFWRTHG